MFHKPKGIIKFKKKNWVVNILKYLFECKEYHLIDFKNWLFKLEILMVV